MAHAESSENLRTTEQKEVPPSLQLAEFGKPEPLNLEKEATKIASMLDFHDPNRLLNYESELVKGAQKLSSDLICLDDNDRNKLLKEVAKSISLNDDSKIANPKLQFQNKDGLTTDPAKADNVTLVSVDGVPAYRFVQPGNTFNQIVKDAFETFIKPARGFIDIEKYEDYRNLVIKLNNIQDPNHIYAKQSGFEKASAGADQKFY